MTKKTNNPHDIAFKLALSDRRVTKALLKQFLPKELQTQMDMRTLKLSLNSFVSDDFKEKMSDVVYSVQVAGKKGYICLIVEHMSTPERWLAFRLFDYTWHALKTYHRQHPKEKLPLIYTLVVYNGARPFKYNTDIRDDIDAPRELVDAYFLKPFQLLDLTQIEDDKLREDVWSGFLLLSFKHARDRDLVTSFKSVLLEIAEHFAQTGNEEYLWIMLKYIVKTTNATEEELGKFRQLVSRRLSSKLGVKMTTLVERLEKKARTQGIAEGKAEGIAEGEARGIAKGEAKGKEATARTIARKLLMQKVTSPKSVAHMTDLPMSVVLAIQKDIKGKH